MSLRTRCWRCGGAGSTKSVVQPRRAKQGRGGRATRNFGAWEARREHARYVPAVWQPTHAFASTRDVLYSGLCGAAAPAIAASLLSPPPPPQVPPVLCGEESARTAAPATRHRQHSSARPSADIEISLEPRQRHSARAAGLDDACAQAPLSEGGTRSAPVLTYLSRPGHHHFTLPPSSSSSPLRLLRSPMTIPDGSDTTMGRSLPAV